MRLLYFLVCVICAYSLSFAQNINYSARISSFSASDCGADGVFDFEREHTWHGWLRDNFNYTETYSGCVTRDYNGAITVNGNYAYRSENDTRATTLIARIDAWEDDTGGRCAYNSGTNGDDCRVNTSINIPFTNPLEYLTQAGQETCGNEDYSMNVSYNYRYVTLNLRDAIDDLRHSYSVSGDRYFWGASGNWANDFTDCAVSGTITDNETSSMSVSVNCQSAINFRWNVSSEADGDYLEVYLNGQLNERISGNTGWMDKQIDLAYGENTIEWRYVKNGSISEGLDRGFVDQITYTPATEINPGSISGDQTVCQGATAATFSSITPAEGYGSTIYYEWQQSSTGVSGWSRALGSSSQETYTPPTYTATTTYYRRRATDNCGGEGLSNVLVVQVNEWPYGSLAGDATICEGNSTDLTFTATAGTGPFDLTINGVNYEDIPTGGSISVSPTTSTAYDLSSITDANTCTRYGAFPGGADVVVETLSTAPEISVPLGLQCPGTTLSLTAGGGTVGTGADIYWYDAPNGWGTLLGTGSTIDVSPTESSTYYVHREGNCNVTTYDVDTVNIRSIGYSPMGSASASDYCIDDEGWHHFYDNGGGIIFSLQGDLSGVTSNPVVTLSNTGSSFQSTIGGDGICDNNTDAGIERFELGRSWDIDFAGTLLPPYAIRYYFPASEKMALESQAANYMMANPDCNYTYRYTDEASGFYWFKNASGTYNAPFQGESPTLLTANMASYNGMEYAEITGITSFSGGSGAIDLQSAVVLPVDLISFTGFSKPEGHLLEWETAVEINNDYFELERSVDPRQGFQTIAQLAGRGRAHTYRYTDDKPLDGYNYYRLRQVDTDGSSSYSRMVKLHHAEATNSWSLAPNPTTGKVNCRFYTQTAKEVHLHIYDQLGRMLSQHTYESEAGRNQVGFNLSTQAAGIYFITLTDANGRQLFRDKLLKQ